MLKQWVLAVLLLISVVSPIQAQESWQINLKDADIGAFISQVADITGKSFVVDPVSYTHLTLPTSDLV